MCLCLCEGAANFLSSNSGSHVATVGAEEMSYLSPKSPRTA